MKIKKSVSRRVFEVFNYTFLTIIMIISLFPLVHMLALSLSSNSAAAAGWVTIFPVNLTFESYKYILEEPEFFRAFGVSVVRVILGTTISALQPSCKAGMERLSLSALCLLQDFGNQAFLFQK